MIEIEILDRASQTIVLFDDVDTLEEGKALADRVMNEYVKTSGLDRLTASLTPHSLGGAIEKHYGEEWQPA
jgi:hypothetical protein